MSLQLWNPAKYNPEAPLQDLAAALLVYTSVQLIFPANEGYPDFTHASNFAIPVTNSKRSRVHVVRLPPLSSGAAPIVVAAGIPPTCVAERAEGWNPIMPELQLLTRLGHDLYLQAGLNRHTATAQQGAINNQILLKSTQ
ncbi:hypothetical protein Q4E40_19910 [Pontibacter sp. BT731]|uniref:hypothetical protein n=1 Tax=Pontibacter coccineus TaxID=3063328 RepID=UPI0026E34032|nr:hypothetical protein [Pontibacter sp. BT731]MDO6392411.1 hypothetical protein [Pontibacter sp. BT731]